ncbi:sigma-54 interaction domain-containing protein [Brevibacillus ginsengisoli]|uniref:sigma-54 interaction domain-containing protein n=1 Tax=Brevibacillus ginsengisoli TaxID=363854 RepID=UPI003CED517E
MPMSDTVEMLQAILGTIDEGIHVVDAEGISIFYNHVAAKLDGLTPDEVLGKPLLEVFPSLSKESSTLLQVIDNGQPIYNQHQTYTNWRGVHVEAVNTTLPVYVEQRLVAAVEVAKDIRKLRELSDRLLKLQAQVGNPKKLKKSETDEVVYRFEDIVTCSPALLMIIERARRAARTSSPVLIYGETGTGKELLVQSIHQASGRNSRPFIAQNCAALPASLLESILFGTTKGSFTGAEDRPGLFELANGGTLFLDELNSMPLELQAKLLRVLQDGQIRRIGSLSSVQVDVRVIAATNEEPSLVVKQGALRPDLYYRLNVVSFALPPLRDRREDIPLLTRHFIDKFNRKFHLKVTGVDDRTCKYLNSYEWPGNVRELEHTIEAAMNLVEGDMIHLEHLPMHIVERALIKRETVDYQPTTGELPNLREALRQTEEKLVLQALAETRGNIKHAAQLLGIPRQTLQYKLTQLGLSADQPNSAKNSAGK